MSCEPRRAKELVKEALEEKLVRLKKTAKTANDRYERCVNAGTELLKIHQEAIAIMNEPIAAEARHKKLKALEGREAKAKKAGRMDLIELMDRDHEARMEVEELESAIANINFYTRGVL
jgi:hypothetical protein